MSFLWLSEEEAQRFFQRIANLDYSEFELSFDYRGRDRWEMRLFDAWGHCFMGAAAADDLGDPSAWFFGGAHEFLKEGLSWVSLNTLAHDSLPQDLFNQAVGRSIGVRNSGGNFGDLCYDAMVEGRLDLTLAGVPRGGRLSRAGPGPTAARSRGETLRAIRERNRTA